MQLTDQSFVPSYTTFVVALVWAQWRLGSWEKYLATLWGWYNRKEKSLIGLRVALTYVTETRERRRAGVRPVNLYRTMQGEPSREKPDLTNTNSSAVSCHVAFTNSKAIDFLHCLSWPVLSQSYPSPLRERFKAPLYNVTKGFVHVVQNDLSYSRSLCHDGLMAESCAAQMNLGVLWNYVNEICWI